MSKFGSFTFLRMALLVGDPFERERREMVRFGTALATIIAVEAGFLVLYLVAAGV